MQVKCKNCGHINTADERGIATCTVCNRKTEAPGTVHVFRPFRGSQYITLDAGSGRIIQLTNEQAQKLALDITTTLEVK